MNRKSFLRVVAGGSLGLFLEIRLPEVAAAPVPVEEIFVTRPLTNITIEYMQKQNHRIPFGLRPPLNPEIGDGWWKMGERGDYEVTRWNGRSWKRAR